MQKIYKTQISETRVKILEMIFTERKRQNMKWGYPQKNSLPEWASILTEETGEVAKEINDIHFLGQPRRPELITELVQVAAVAISIIEHMMEEEPAVENETRIKDKIPDTKPIHKRQPEQQVPGQLNKKRIYKHSSVGGQSAANQEV